MSSENESKKSAAQWPRSATGRPCYLHQLLSSIAGIGRQRRLLRSTAYANAKIVSRIEPRRKRENIAVELPPPLPRPGGPKCRPPSVAALLFTAMCRRREREHRMCVRRQYMLTSVAHRYRRACRPAIATGATAADLLEIRSGFVDARLRQQKSVKKSPEHWLSW